MSEELEFGATIDENEGKGGGSFKKTEYLSMKGGEYTIRILDAMETKQYAHFVGKSWLECLGDECPICQNNKKIIYEHPEDFRDVDGWLPRRPRFSLNVLDKADGKVKVLQCGPRLIEDLKVMSKGIRNEQDERIDIRHYDWLITVSGNGREKTYTPSHRYFGKETTPDLQGQELYDLSKVMIRLTPEEMLDVYNGASIKDVFALRRAKKEVVNSLEGNLGEDILADIDASVDEIFKQ